MNDLPWPSLLRCDNCGQQEVCTRDQMIERLGEVKMLRRVVEPEAEVLAELWSSSVPRFTCQSCGQPGMTLAPIEDDGVDWGEPRECEVCRQLIPPGRLEIFPNARLCASCQTRDDRGETPEADVDYCPHCGEIMRLRTASRGGTTGYKLVCPGCRRSVG